MLEKQKTFNKHTSFINHEKFQLFLPDFWYLEYFFQFYRIFLKHPRGTHTQEREGSTFKNLMYFKHGSIHTTLALRYDKKRERSKKKVKASVGVYFHAKTAFCCPQQ